MKLNKKGSIKLGLVGLVLLGMGACTIAPHLDRDVYRATVTEKQVKRYNDSDKYLIFTELEDGSTKVFENTDSLIEWKFGSSDMYAKLKEDHTYKIKTYGWRIPFLSWYENIIGVEEVEE